MHKIIFATLLMLSPLMISWNDCPLRDAEPVKSLQCDYCGTCEYFPRPGAYGGISVASSGVYHDTPRKGEFMKVSVSADQGQVKNCMNIQFKVPRPDADGEGPNLDISLSTLILNFDDGHYPGFTVSSVTQDGCRDATRVRAMFTDARGCVCEFDYPTVPKGFFQPADPSTKPPDPPAPHVGHKGC